MPFKYSSAASVLPRMNHLLRCPTTGEPLRYEDGVCSTADGRVRYDTEKGIPDLRVSPARIVIDSPWFDPWPQLEKVDLSYPDVPDAVKAPQLPYHLTPHHAAIAGIEGNGRRLLEIGCGERQCEPYFVERGFQYLATDVDVRGPGPHVMADAHNLPFRDESFDLCYAMAVLQHVAHPWLAVQEAYRVLKPGGVLFGAAAFVSPVCDRSTFFHFSYSGLQTMFRSAGFEQVQVWPAWPYYESIPRLNFSRRFDWPWKIVTHWLMALSEWSYMGVSNMVRRVTRKEPIDPFMRRVTTAGGLNFAAYKPPTTP